MDNSIIKKPLYNRIILKISGEIFQGYDICKIDVKILKSISQEIKRLVNIGIQIGIVIGGGNIIRGSMLKNINISKVTADNMGILATIMNGLVLRDILNNLSIKTCLMSATKTNSMCEDYNLEKVLDCFNNKKVVIFSGGIGHPFFTTDTAACLRAIETQSDVVLKATKVNGIYSSDPEQCCNAIKYRRLSYSYIIKKEFKVMDLTAFILARDHNVPICIFNMYDIGVLYKIVMGQKIGTMVGALNK
ncbi:UMP kinase [Buchnera aphidicola]|uniref:UMP kinase n=1 Tax=Buchnera aphidicola TaxID=9 RepID=UPI0031B7F9FB